MKIQPRQFAGTNRYCAGYASALSIVQHKMRPTIELEANEFILVINSTRISRITDYSCSETAGLFGDMATATMISRVDSDKYPVHFELLDASVEPVQVSRPFFDFSCRDQIRLPSKNEGTQMSGRRIVFTLDGMGIADAAARGMASAATKMSAAIGVHPDEVNSIIPHQAGVAIVRLAEMKLRETGYTCEVVNGLTEHAGNVSSASVPFAISEKWDQLNGLVLCPVASVGPPGKPVVFQGCIALRSLESDSR
jgi:3-oxoacyl-[acyl-carrier-protein] synthase III